MVTPRGLCISFFFNDLDKGLQLLLPASTRLEPRKVQPFFKLETEPVHPLSVTPNRVTVSRYRTPISGIRWLLLHNDRHLYIDV